MHAFVESLANFEAADAGGVIRFANADLPCFPSRWTRGKDWVISFDQMQIGTNQSEARKGGRPDLVDGIADDIRGGSVAVVAVPLYLCKKLLWQGTRDEHSVAGGSRTN